ncbi:hypothetical protein JCM10213_003483 [Rhodosporidiobolus nylandii]
METKPALLDASGDAALPTARLREADREKLRVVVESLAPPMVLDQPLDTPGLTGQTLRAVLGAPATEEGGVELSVLRAALTNASTSALLSSTMMVFDEAGQAASARLLNEIDEFQRTVTGVVDELERKALAPSTSGKGKGKGVKREADDSPTPAASQPPSKLRKYMLHRSLATGVDLFTSATILNETDLTELAGVEDTDLISVLPPLPTSSSAAAASSTPSLGSSVPPPPSTLLTFPLPPLQQAGLAPSPSASSSREEGCVDLSSRGEGCVDLLYYSPYSSFAPAFDSSASSARGGEGYSRTAGRALASARRERWERAALSAPVLPAAPAFASLPARELGQEEKQALAALGVSEEEWFKQVEELEVWRELERNARLVERVGGRQGARVSKLAEGREEKGVEGVKKEQEEGEGVKVEGAEKEEADALLSSLSSLIAHRRASSTSTSTLSSASARLIPPPSLLRHLTPLLMASSAREPSYRGTLDEVNFRAVREGGMGAQGTGVQQGL